MSSLQKYTCYIRTLSKVILSPRMQQAYLNIDALEKKQLRGKTINLIYPFYQYGKYDTYNPKATEYYIPGSSLKGALTAGITINAARSLLVDDIPLKPDNILLDELQKIQNRHSETKQIKLAAFFEKVAIEMCKEGTSMTLEMFCTTDFITELLENKIIEKNINHWLNEVEKILEMEKIDNETKKILEESQKKLSQLIIQSHEKNTSLLVLGGYKGLLLSRDFSKKELQDLKSGIFIDKSTCLPYGLIEVIGVEKNE